MTKNEQFYVSFELAEVVDLVLEREVLLKAFKLSDERNDKVLASHIITKTTRLETLVKKDKD